MKVAGRMHDLYQFCTIRYSFEKWLQHHCLEFFRNSPSLSAFISIIISPSPATDRRIDE